MYICAWQAPALPPLRLTSSRMIDASVTPRPEPPYSSGNQCGEIPRVRQRSHERVGIRSGRVELAPVRVRKRLAEVADSSAQVLVEVGGRHEALESYNALMKKIAAGLCLIACVAVVTSAQSGTVRLLVLNKEDATLAIVDPSSGRVMGKVPVGQGPHELVTSFDGKTAFASNYGTGPAPGHTISMIDVAGMKELRRIDVAPLSRPHGLAFANGKLYFTIEADKKIARYDPVADKIDWQFETGQIGTHMVLPSRDAQHHFHVQHRIRQRLDHRSRRRWAVDADRDSSRQRSRRDRPVAGRSTGVERTLARRRRLDHRRAI